MRTHEYVADFRKFGIALQIASRGDAGQLWQLWQVYLCLRIPYGGNRRTPRQRRSIAAGRNRADLPHSCPRNRRWVTTLGYDTFLGERQLQVGSYATTATMCGCCSFFIMRINRRSKCQFCECKPVGRTTSEVKWHLCYRHLRAAGGNGFLPVFYGTKSKIMPGRAVRMTVEE